nr:MAG TPA: putative transcriptional regulator [Caudoviricetes sp.]
MRVHVVCAVFSISPATAWRWTREGRLPEPRRIGPKVTAWPVGALREVLNRAAPSVAA